MLRGKGLIIVTSIVATVVIAMATYLYYVVKPIIASAADSLPSNILDPVAKTTIITDRDGEPLYYLYKGENRLIIPSRQIPQIMREAVIAAEDERFYYHHGVDTISSVRALVSDFQHKSIVSGGSTITMQLVKNITGDKRPNWQRKLKEAYLATLLEQHYSKDEILTLYLNIVPLGNNIAGIETASRFYYGKAATNLTLQEAATLAALPSAPQYYYENPASLKKRRDYVLSRMVSTGFISESEREKAATANTALREPTIPFKAQHFVMEIVNQLKNKYGESIYTKGFRVKTSLDMTTQTMAEAVISRNQSVLANVGAENVALTAVDPKTGEVLAMVGSKDYFNNKAEGQVNLATATLSYGSTLKPLIYAMLLNQEHWSPGAIMWDVKTEFPIQGERKPYIPQNYDRRFMGPVTLRQALGNSRNVPAIKALELVGLNTLLTNLPEFGIESLGSNSSRYGPSLAVGGGGIPLLQMVGAYTALANSGNVNPAQMISQITDYKGAKVLTSKPLNRPVIKPEIAYELADILQDNNARKAVFGTHSPLVIDGHTVAAKTGTGEDYRTALTIGFTPNIVVGVIVANNNNAPLRFGGSGAMAAAPFWHDFMTNYLANKPNIWYAQPDTVKETEFATVLGNVRDLTTSWQSPIDRFNKRVAEINDPNWNKGVASTKKPEESKKDESVLVNIPIPSSSPTQNQN